MAKNNINFTFIVLDRKSKIKVPKMIEFTQSSYIMYPSLSSKLECIGGETKERRRERNYEQVRNFLLTFIRGPMSS